MNTYVELTRLFNKGKLRCIISSYQAAALHGIATTSKDGEWIIREDEECCRHVLAVLEQAGAKYRCGAPLDVRLLAGGWVAHFVFPKNNVQIRADFASRPPRVSSADLSRLWLEEEGKDPAFLNLRILADTKKTDREEDYVLVGEVAKKMSKPPNQAFYFRNAQDLVGLAKNHPDIFAVLAPRRPALAEARNGAAKLQAALDAERRSLMMAYDKWQAAFAKAAVKWTAEWKKLEPEIKGLPLAKAHELIAKRAHGILPLTVQPLGQHG